MGVALLSSHFKRKRRLRATVRIYAQRPFSRSFKTFFFYNCELLYSKIVTFFTFFLSLFLRNSRLHLSYWIATWTVTFLACFFSVFFSMTVDFKNVIYLSTLLSYISRYCSFMALIQLFWIMNLISIYNQIF